MTNRIETKRGTQSVISTRNGEGSIWTSTVYVNNGETITNVRAKHATAKGATAWANRQLGAVQA